MKPNEVFQITRYESNVIRNTNEFNKQPFNGNQFNRPKLKQNERLPLYPIKCLNQIHGKPC